MKQTKTENQSRTRNIKQRERKKPPIQPQRTRRVPQKKTCFFSKKYRSIKRKLKREIAKWKKKPKTKKGGKKRDYVKILSDLTKFAIVLVAIVLLIIVIAFIWDLFNSLIQIINDNLNVVIGAVIVIPILFVTFEILRDFGNHSAIRYPKYNNRNLKRDLEEFIERIKQLRILKKFVERAKEILKKFRDYLRKKGEKEREGDNDQPSEGKEVE